MKLAFSVVITFLTIANLFASIAPRQGVPKPKKEISIPAEFVYPANELDSLFAPPAHLKDKTFLLELAKDSFFSTQRDDEKIYYGSLILETRKNNAMILFQMMQSMQRLGKTSQITHLLDHCIKQAGIEKNTNILSFIACYYAYNLPKGVMVDSVFHIGAEARGRDKINGDILYAQQRFRVLGLRQLMYALNLCETDTQRFTVYACMAKVLTLHTNPQNAFKKKTSLAKLPHLELKPFLQDEKRYKLCFYEVPKDIYESKNDGEWHRFCINQMIKINPEKGNEIWFDFVRNLYNCDYDAITGSDSEMAPMTEKLKENEIFRLKTANLNQFSGNNRFDIIQVPDDYNLISLASRRGGDSLYNLAEIFQERKNFPKAVELYKQALSHKKNGEKILENMQKNHYNNNKDDCPLETSHLTTELVKLCSNKQNITSSVTPKDGLLLFDLTFRNAREIKSEIFKLNTDSYLQLSEQYLKNVPLKDRQQNGLNHSKYPYHEWRLGDLLLKTDTELNLWGEKMGEFMTPLNPRQHYLLEEKIALKTQLPQGDYILKVTAHHGNIYYALFTINDIQIEVKPFKDSILFLVCDAQTGRGIPNTKIELFAYKTHSFDANKIQPDRTHFEIQYKNISLKTNSEGVVVFQHQNKEPFNISGLITTQDGKKAIIDPFTYHELMHWNGSSPNLQNAYRSFTVTNQNVYRPGQVIKMAGFYRKINPKQGMLPDLFTSIDLCIKDRDNVTVYEKKIDSTPDGGYEAEFTLPDDAKLGKYTGTVNTKAYFERFNFNVEAYRKGEYEIKVTLDSAQKLGDSLFISASAFYYAGGKDFKGRAKIKIETQDDLEIPKPFYGRWHHLYQRSYGIARPTLKTVFEEEREVDALGNILVAIPTEHNSVSPNRSRTYTAHVTWVNAANRTEKATQSMVLYPQPFKLESKLNQAYYTLGEPICFTHKIERTQGYDAPLEQTIKVVRTDENAITQTVQETALTHAEPFKFTPQASGFYTLTYTVKNQDFLDSCIQTCIVYEKNAPIYADAPLKVYKKAQLATVGKKTQILVSSSIKNGVLYIFGKPKNGTHQQLETRPFTNGAIELEFEVTSDDTPNFFVELMIVGNHQKENEIINFMVPPEDQTLKIIIEAPLNKVPPHKELIIPFTVKNNQNEGVSVPCIVTIYDVALDVFSAGFGADIYSVFLNKMYDFQYTNLFKLQQLNNEFPPPNEWGDLKPVSPPPYLLQNNYFFGFTCMDQGEFNAIHLSSGFPVYAMAFSSGSDFARSRRYEDNAAFYPKNPNHIPQKAIPAIRSKFLDAPYFNARILTDRSGRGEIKFKTPDNLGKFWIKIWAASCATKIGYQVDSFIIGKEVMLRIQTPRFLVQGDSILITANVQNESKTEQTVDVKLLIDGKALTTTAVPQVLTIPPMREAEAKFALEAQQVGKGVLTVSAVSQEEKQDDAMRVDFPIISREIEKIIRQSTTLINGKNCCEFELTLPKERVGNTSRIQIDLSPSLEVALIESLPYLVGYPHHSVEQTLNRFLPAAYLNKTLHDLGITPDSVMRGVRPLSEKAIIGFTPNNDPIFSDNPVYSDTFVRDATRVGLNRIFNMQQGDGWNWFPGGNIDFYMTSLVFEGLIELKTSNIAVDNQMFEQCKQLLKNYQAERLKRRLLPVSDAEHLSCFSNLDMRMCYLLEKVKRSDARMIEILLKEYPQLSIQSACYLGLIMHEINRPNKAREIQSYIEQYLKIDKETQTAYLNLPDARYFWYWYGDDMVTHAVYLRLLLISEAKSEKCAYLVNHMINNRKNSCAWNSTLSTSICVRALSDYLRKTYQKVAPQNVKIFINDTLLTDSIFVLPHHVELFKIRIERETTNGPLFVQASATFNTQEKMIAAAGHEIKIQRHYFLRRYETVAINRPNYAGVMKTHYQRLSSRTELKKGDVVAEGDEIDVHLIVRANNDYEYLVLTDPRGAGFESIHSQSGYIHHPLWHFVEYRDLGVNFYINRLTQGRHVFTYTLRAEKAGTFTALPSIIVPMYLPKLKANSAEQRLEISQPK